MSTDSRIKARKHAPKAVVQSPKAFKSTSSETWNFSHLEVPAFLMCPPFSFAHWGREYFDTANISWKSVEKEFYFEDLEECAVHTLAHECFHFLSDSGQVKEKNYEANANWWGDLWLTEFKNNR